MSQSDRELQLARIGDPGIEEILSLIFKEKEERLSPEATIAHRNLAVWLAFLTAGELPEDLQYTFSCLQTGLRFRDTRVRARSLEGMLDVSSEAELSDLYENLHSYKVTRLFLEVASEYSDWQANAGLLLNCVKLVNLILANNVAFVQLIQEQGFLSVAVLGMRMAQTDPGLKLALLEFVSHYMQNNTLTVLQTLYETWDVKSQLTESDRSDPLWRFVQRSLPLYGSQSVKLLLKLYRNHVLRDVNDVMQALVEVPYYFKVPVAEDIISALGELMQRLESGKAEARCIALKSLLSNLADLLIAPKWFEFAHITGVCTNRMYTTGLLDSIGKHPLLFYCKRCLKPLCCICINSPLHDDHERQFLGYQKDYYYCANTDVEHMDFNFDFVFTWPGIKISTYITTTQNEKYIDTIRVTDSEKLQLRTEHPLCFLEDIGDEATAAYFEVYVIQGGEKDCITLGLGSEKEPIISFCGMDGAITVRGKFRLLGPKFGSYDTVGVGITSKGSGFVTYNGLLVRPLLPLNFLADNVFAFISLQGAGTLVSPQSLRNNWKFRPDLVGKDTGEVMRVEGVNPALLDKIFRAVERMVRALEKWGGRADLQSSISVVVNMAALFLRAFHREDLMSAHSRKDFGGALSNQLCNAERCCQF